MRDGTDIGRLKLSVSGRALKLVSAFLVALATAAILSTARVFSGTVDEPAHIAAGMQWLTTDRYDYDLQHPPLGRVAAALGPYLQGVRNTNATAIYDEGANILGKGRDYVDRLASARHGVIVFFLALALLGWAWGRTLGGEIGAALATIFLITNPNVLAHAGLATTDIACAAMTTLALFAGAWWIERPNLNRSLWFGVAIGAAVSSRLSAIAFVGAGLLAGYLVRGFTSRQWRIDPEGNLRQSVVAAIAITLAMLFVIWGAYRFAIGPMSPGGAVVPAPAFVSGVERFLLHGSSGHPTFLLGTPSNRGWWYYFPVALLVKTPPPLLFAGILGAVVAVKNLRERRDWRGALPLVFAAAILLVSLTAKVNLGVRLVLPMYPLLAIVGAHGLTFVIREQASRVGPLAAAGLVAWAVITPVRSHPDHLAYFNALAGDHPEHVLVDSNLDWGQDLYRLRDTIVARGITDSVRVAYFGTGDLAAAGVPRARLLGLHERATGWIAASETYLAGEWVGRAYAWLLDYPPVARIGPSMRLWYIGPVDSVSAGSPTPPGITGPSPR